MDNGATVTINLGKISMPKADYDALRSHFSHREIVEEIRDEGQDALWDFYRFIQKNFEAAQPKVKTA